VQGVPPIGISVDRTESLLPLHAPRHPHQNSLEDVLECGRRLTSVHCSVRLRQHLLILTLGPFIQASIDELWKVLVLDWLIQGGDDFDGCEVTWV